MCFPTTLDPQTDLPLCGFEVPSPPTAQTDNSSTRLNHNSTTTLVESPLTEDITVSFLLTAGGSYNGFSIQKSDSTLIAFHLGVTFAAMLLCSIKYS